MNKSHLEVEESKDAYQDSLYVKISQCGTASEDDIRSFFQGIEIEVSTHKSIYNFLDCRSQPVWSRHCQVSKLKERLSCSSIRLKVYQWQSSSR